MAGTSGYAAVIDFWFTEIDSSFWFKKDLEFDQDIRDRFSITHSQAVRGELFLLAKRTLRASCRDYRVRPVFEKYVS